MQTTQFKKPAKVVRKLKKEKDEKSEPLILEKIDFADLPADAQKEYLRVKNLPAEEFVKS